MAVAETAKLIVDLSLKGNFAKQLQTSGRALGKFDARLDHTESRAYRAGQQIGTGIKRGAALAAVGVGLITTQVIAGLDSLVDLEKQTAQTNAAIKSTKGVAGVTAAEVRKLAESFEAMNATIGDEVIQSSENLLLTFTNIRKNAFKPALQAILDINTRLGRGPDGLAGTARQVGKALNDPTKGLAALTRLGITFDKKTTERIKKLQKQNKLFDAQSLILRELNKRFGGSFLAEGGTTGAKVAKFKDAIEDLQRTLAAGLLPVVSNVADALSKLLADPQVQKDVEAFGKDLAKFFSKDNIEAGVRTIGDIINGIKGFVTTVGPAVGVAADAIGKLVSAFNSLPPELKSLLLGAFVVQKATNGLLTNIAGGLAGALKNLVVGSMSVQAANVTVAGGTGGGGVPGAAPAAAKGGLGVLGKLFLVGEAIGLVAAVNAVRESVQNSATQQAQEVHSTLTDFLSRPNTTDAQLQTALDGVNQGIHDLNTDPLAVALVSGPALAELQNMKAILENRLPQSKGGAAPDASLQQHLHDEHIQRGDSAVKKSIDDSKAKLAAQIAETKRETTRGVNATNATKGAVNATKNAVSIGDNHVAATVSSSSAIMTGAIVGAIWAARPNINVTNVTKTTTIQNRYGSGNGSQGSDALHNAGGH